MLKYFSGTAIFTLLDILLPVTVTESPMKLDLYLKDDELSTETLSGFPTFVAGDYFLLNCHKLLEVSEQLSLYSIKMCIGITISRL